MARFGGMTALRAALGGVTGALGGMSEQQAIDEQRRRQALMDQVMLQDKGYVPEAQATADRAASGSALSRAFSMAASAARPGAPMAGAMLPGDTAKIERALELQAPQQTLDVSGTRYQRELPSSREAREQELQFGRARSALGAKESREAQEFERQVRDARTSLQFPKGMSEADKDAAARQYARTGKSPFERLSIADIAGMSAQRRGMTAGQEEARRQELFEAEAWWNQNVTGDRNTQSANAPAITAAFRRMRAAAENKDKSPQEIMLALYRSWPKQSASGGGNDYLNQILQQELQQPTPASNPTPAAQAKPAQPPAALGQALKGVDMARYSSDPEYRAFVNSGGK